MKPRCYYCKTSPPKPAKYPEDNPRWCSQKCAALWAVAMIEGDGLTWNPVIGDWCDGYTTNYDD
jgi:hypothetical protein